MDLSLIVPLLLAAAQPAAVPPAAVDETGWSWCVADAAGPAGQVRYFSDPFEGDADIDIQRAFREYLDQSYTASRKTSGYAVACRSFPDLAAANAELRADSTARTGVTDVMTKWRAHFQ